MKNKPLLTVCLQGSFLFWAKGLVLFWLMGSNQPGRRGHPRLGFPLAINQYTFSTPCKKRSPDNLMIIRASSYPDPGSNRDGSPQRCLRPSRLPIPPSGRWPTCLSICFVYAKVVSFFCFRNTVGHFEINVDTNVLPICNCENYSVSSGWVYQREYIR